MKSAMFCEHANEVPLACPCKDDCYCKTHTCFKEKKMAGKETWPTVDYFAMEMKKKLDENKEKGDRDTWLCDDAKELLARLKEEVEELSELVALEASMPASMKASKAVMEELSLQVAREAADVGNFAMMVADKLNGLKL